MHLEQTIQKLKRLRLTAMSESFIQRLDRGDHRNIAAEEFFAVLVDDEVEARTTKRVRYLMGRANLRPEKACLENIRYEKGRGFSKPDLERFYRQDWIERGENMVFTGATGTGKSYLAEALVFQSCKMGHQAIKYSLDRLLEEIRASRAMGQYAKFMKQMERTKVLVVDDFAIANYTQQQYCEVLHLLEERTGRSSTIITSQYPIAKWYERIPDPTLADAICDRMIVGAWNLELKGPSLRGRS